MLYSCESGREFNTYLKQGNPGPALLQPSSIKMQWSCCAIWWEGGSRKAAKLLQPAPCSQMLRSPSWGGGWGTPREGQWEVPDSPCPGVWSTSPRGRAALQPSPEEQGWGAWPGMPWISGRVRISSLLLLIKPHLNDMLLSRLQQWSSSYFWVKSLQNVPM